MPSARLRKIHAALGGGTRLTVFDSAGRAPVAPPGVPTSPSPSPRLRAAAECITTRTCRILTERLPKREQLLAANVLCGWMPLLEAVERLAAANTPIHAPEGTRTLHEWAVRVAQWAEARAPLLQGEQLDLEGDLRKLERAMFFRLLQILYHAPAAAAQPEVREAAFRMVSSHRFWASTLVLMGGARHVDAGDEVAWRRWNEIFDALAVDGNPEPLLGVTAALKTDAQAALCREYANHLIKLLEAASNIPVDRLLWYRVDHLSRFLSFLTPEVRRQVKGVLEAFLQRMQPFAQETRTGAMSLSDEGHQKRNLIAVCLHLYDVLLAPGQPLDPKVEALLRAFESPRWRPWHREKAQRIRLAHLPPGQRDAELLRYLETVTDPGRPQDVDPADQLAALFREVPLDTAEQHRMLEAMLRTGGTLLAFAMEKTARYLDRENARRLADWLLVSRGRLFGSDYSRERYTYQVLMGLSARDVTLEHIDLAFFELSESHELSLENLLKLGISWRSAGDNPEIAPVLEALVDEERFAEHQRLYAVLLSSGAAHGKLSPRVRAFVRKALSGIRWEEQTEEIGSAYLAPWRNHAERFPALPHGGKRVRIRWRYPYRPVYEVWLAGYCGIMAVHWGHRSHPLNLTTILKSWSSADSRMLALGVLLYAMAAYPLYVMIQAVACPFRLGYEWLKEAVSRRIYSEVFQRFDELQQQVLPQASVVPDPPVQREFMRAGRLSREEMLGDRAEAVLTGLSLGGVRIFYTAGGELDCLPVAELASGRRPFDPAEASH